MDPPSIVTLAAWLLVPMYANANALFPEPSVTPMRRLDASYASDTVMPLGWSFVAGDVIVVRFPNASYVKLQVCDA